MTGQATVREMRGRSGIIGVPRSGRLDRVEVLVGGRPYLAKRDV